MDLTKFGDVCLAATWKVDAARIRIDALMHRANIRATVESIVANFNASRFSGKLSP